MTRRSLLTCLAAAPLAAQNRDVKVQAPNQKGTVECTGWDEYGQPHTRPCNDISLLPPKSASPIISLDPGELFFVNQRGDLQKYGTHDKFVAPLQNNDNGYLFSIEREPLRKYSNAEYAAEREICKVRGHRRTHNWPRPSPVTQNIGFGDNFVAELAEPSPDTPGYSDTETHSYICYFCHEHYSLVTTKKYEDAEE